MTSLGHICVLIPGPYASTYTGPLRSQNMSKCSRTPPVFSRLSAMHKLISLLPPPLPSPAPTYSTIRTPFLPVDFAPPPWVQVSVPFCCLIVTPQDGARDLAQLGWSVGFLIIRPRQPDNLHNTPTTCITTLSTLPVCGRRQQAIHSPDRRMEVQNATTAPGK